jgi:hypothetical protein
MYDWKRIIEDKVPCYFWNKLGYNIKECGYLIDFTTSFYLHVISDENNKYEFCEPIRTEDKEAYAIKEPVKVWRPCKTLEEFMPFMGKIAINKNRKSDNILRLICYLDKGDVMFSAEFVKLNGF